MKRYDPRTPRAFFALAAVTITVATLAISVLAPARIDPLATQGDLATSVASEHCAASDHTAVTGIDVVAVRTSHRAPLAQLREAMRGVVRS